VHVHRGAGERLGATALAREVERALAPAGVDHLQVTIEDDAHGERLAPGFAALGWRAQQFVLMAARRPPGRAPRADVEVVELDHDVHARAWAAYLRTEPFGADEATVAELVMAQDRWRAAAPGARALGVLADDEAVAVCIVLGDGATGQIEDVATLPAHRGRGLARAVVLHALAASRAAGDELTFIVADAADWPRRLYARLGFEPLGHYRGFTRLPPGHPGF